jgi:hypothetical protein
MAGWKRKAAIDHRATQAQPPTSKHRTEAATRAEGLAKPLDSARLCGRSSVRSSGRSSSEDFFRLFFSYQHVNRRFIAIPCFAHMLRSHSTCSLPEQANKGFAMLMKMGFKAGNGLGLRADGEPSFRLLLSSFFFSFSFSFFFFSDGFKSR